MQENIRQTLASKVYEVAEKTPLNVAPKLSEKIGAEVLLKREDLQPVFSFKIRGAYNKIANLSQNELKKGVIAVSAGNHAQGVALSAQKLEIDALIVMPNTTPDIKVNAVKNYGASVELYGDNYSEAAEYAKSVVEQTGMTFIHPFDDDLVIAGQGTVGMEIYEQASDVSAIFVPIGGGGLIAGIGRYVKAVNPDIQIIGVEPEDADAMKQSLEAGRLVNLEQVGIFADGVAVKTPGQRTFEAAMDVVDEVITVNTDEICAAIKDIYLDTRTVMEPAGALGVAGIVKYSQNAKNIGKKYVAICSGANMTFERLQFVAERTLVGENTEALFSVKLPETPGALRKFVNQLTGFRSITEFNYRLHSRNEARIFVGVTIADSDDKTKFKTILEDKGFEVDDLTDNELAKVHVRHMVGGKGEYAENEVLYRFNFPERPGALSDFLDTLQEKWNISLFHYRAIGGDVGRVLMGFEVPEKDRKEFKALLDQINYPYWDESKNTAYNLFL